MSPIPICLDCGREIFNHGVGFPCAQFRYGGGVIVSKTDPVRPAHYTALSIQPVEVIESWGLGFNLGTVAKYLGRAGRKGAALEDLRKARWYLDREIANLEKAGER